jgi:hypothetical protein
MEEDVRAYAFSYSQAQVAYEYEILFRDLTGDTRKSPSSP